MKKLLSLLMCGLLLFGCSKEYDDSDIKKRLDNLENTRIPSIESQVAAIQTSLPLLRQTDEEIKGYIATLQGKVGKLEQSMSDVDVKIKALEYTLQTDFSQRLAEIISQLNAHKQEIQNKIDSFNLSIESLQSADTELEKKISYLDGKIDMQKDWVTATFATLTQYNGLVADIATIRTNIETINKNIADLETRITEKMAADIATAVGGLQEEIRQKVTEITDAYTAAIGTAKNEITAAYTSAISSAIDNCIASMKDWVNEKLANYYNITAIDAKVQLLQNAITDGDKKLDEAIKEKETLLKDAIANSEKALQKAIADGDVALQNKIEQYITSLQEELDNSVQALETQIQTAKEALEQAIIAGDNALQKTLTEEIERLENKINENYEALNKKVSEETAHLQEEIDAVNTALDSAKAELTAAYTNAIKTAIETNNGLINKEITDAIASITEKIDTEVGTLNNKISSIKNRIDELEQEINDKILALDNRVSDLETDVAALLKRIQSVSFIPRYSDGIANMERIVGKDNGVAEFDFMISPKDAVVELEKVWRNTITMKAIYTQTRTISFIELPIINFETDIENGIITTSVSGENLSDDFFLNEVSASAALFISNGNNKIISDYVPMLSNDVNVIYYTSNTGATINANIESIPDCINNIYTQGRGSIIFKDKITMVPDSAFFRCNDLKSIILPYCVTTIGYHAFACRNLENIVLSNSITTIKSYAFSGTRLTNITLPRCIKKISYDTFSNCYLLTNIVIPNGVKTIQSNAFGLCEKLTNVTIPESVTLIDVYAFYDCGYMSIYCKPNNPPKLRDSAFNGTSISNIYVPKTSVDLYKSTDVWKKYASKIIGYDFN